MPWQPSNAAYRPMMAMAEAQRAGYPVFGCVGAQDLGASVAALMPQLRAELGYLVLPAFDLNGSYLSDDAVREYVGYVGYVGYGIPLWVYPVHRRVDAAHYFALGVAGAVCSSYGYVAGSTAPLDHDTWRSRAIAPGEMSKQPGLPSYAPVWTGQDELTLQRPATQQFITLGQLSPVRQAAASYRIEFQARWTRLSHNPNTQLSLTFGHLDDRYYEQSLGKSTGYDAVMREDGSLELRTHVAGSRTDAVLGTTATPPPGQGQWMSFRLSVTPSSVTWSRIDLDAAEVVAYDSRIRGGYLHIGRSSTDRTATVTFRALSVT